MADSMTFFWSVIGVVLVFEGMPWFLSPDGARRMLQQMNALPDSTLRLFGAVLMSAGLLLVWFATS